MLGCAFYFEALPYKKETIDRSFKIVVPEISVLNLLPIGCSVDVIMMCGDVYP